MRAGVLGQAEPEQVEGLAGGGGRQLLHPHPGPGEQGEVREDSRERVLAGGECWCGFAIPIRDVPLLPEVQER